MQKSKLCKLVLLLFLISSINVTAIIPGKGFFDTAQIAYYEEVKNVLSLSSEQESMLEKYGFVVVELSNDSAPDPGEPFNPALRFEDFYFYKVYHNDLPVFVTTDSILHLFHVVFDCSLKLVEKQALYPMALEISQFAYEKSLSDYLVIPHDYSTQYWAVRNSTVYFAVALSLLTGETVDIPTELEGDLSYFLDNIYAEEPQMPWVGGWSLLDFDPPVDIVLKYDFTQFTVRGHYLGDVQLEQYFRALTWYGRFPFFVPRNQNESYLWYSEHIDDIAMVYMRDILRSSSQIFERWMLLYEVTRALVGESDSINLINLEVALNNVFGEADYYLDYVDSEDGLWALREELSKPEYSQQILGQAIISGPSTIPRYPLVFQFMGQRYVPDSYIFQKLCWDQVLRNSFDERRILPKGLDVFAVLGSERAYQLLAPDFDFEGFGENFANLTSTFGNWSESDWLTSSYTAWIYVLESLVEPTFGENSYPEFMQNEAWQDEKLNTALGSWAQLRHDTILYAKQTYIPVWICSYPEAFAEPNPTFYARMQDLCERTMNAVSILDTSDVEPTILMSLETLKNATQKLQHISEKELAGEPLTAEEIEFLKQIVHKCGSGGFIGWYVDTIHGIANAANSTSTLEVPVIADVATFPPDDVEYSPQILHVGTGYVNALVVLYPKLDGTLVAAVGPVFSYYEFRLKGTKRLNDDEWKTMLTWDNRTEYLPDWFQTLYGRADPIPFPEYPHINMIVVFVVLTPIVFVIGKGLKAKKKLFEPSSQERKSK